MRQKAVENESVAKAAGVQVSRRRLLRNDESRSGQHLAYQQC